MNEQKIRMVISPSGETNTEVIDGCGSSCKTLLESMGIDTTNGEELPEYHTDNPEQEQEVE